MSDVLFLGALVVWFWLIGRLPCALLPSAGVRGRELAAPVLGFALFGVLASALYRFDVPASALFALGSALAAGGLVLLFIRPPARPGRSAAALAALAIATALLLVLPKWTGGPQFFVFQGNVWDQLSYLARSVSYRQFTYGELMAAERTMPLLNDFVLFARSELTERPAISIVHAAVSALAAEPPTENAYVFMAFLELLSFFAFAFALTTLCARGPVIAGLAASALALGFFLQYVFDINAWSELAGLPIALLSGTLALVLLDRRAAREDWRLAALVSLALAATLYYYPEIVPVYAAPLAVVVLCGMGFSARADRIVPAKLLWLGAAALVAVGLTVPCWDGTMGVLFRQIHSAVSSTNDWFAYYQHYLIPLDLSDQLAAAYKSGELPRDDLWQAALFIPIDVMSGLFGLYFLGPPALPLALRIAWRLAVLAGLVMLLASALRTVLPLLRRGPVDRAGRLALWALAAFFTPLPLLALGKMWAAGKAVSMIGPFLFLIAAAPVLLAPGPRAGGGIERRRHHLPSWCTKENAWRLPALVYLAAEIGFGIARPIAAAHPDGIHYASPPYPSIQVAKYKTALSWDLARHDDALRHCRRIAVDVESPFLERYVQLHLTELDSVWWSLHPLNTYFDRGKILGLQPPKGEPDCLVTDRKGASAPPGVTSISLAR